jgi:hypothetical protein
MDQCNITITNVVEACKSHLEYTKICDLMQNKIKFNNESVNEIIKCKYKMNDLKIIIYHILNYGYDLTTDNYKCIIMNYILADLY